MGKIATNKQTRALFCITKKDYRNKNLTFDQASKLIEKLNKEKNFEKSSDTKTSYSDIWITALANGEREMQACNPTPMVVQQHQNIFDDSSKVIAQEIVY